MQQLDSHKTCEFTTNMVSLWLDKTAVPHRWFIQAPTKYLWRSSQRPAPWNKLLSLYNSTLGGSVHSVLRLRPLNLSEISRTKYHLVLFWSNIFLPVVHILKVLVPVWRSLSAQHWCLVSVCLNAGLVRLNVRDPGLGATSSCWFFCSRRGPHETERAGLSLYKALSAAAAARESQLMLNKTMLIWALARDWTTSLWSSVNLRRLRRPTVLTDPGFIVTVCSALFVPSTFPCNVPNTWTFFLH